MKSSYVACTVALATTLLSSALRADVTGDTGGSQPHSNMQSSLAINYLISLNGTYPIANSPEGNAPTIGEIIMSASGVTPAGYAECNGQLLPIQNNEALFSLIGNTYGGDGNTTFALPDLQGRTAVGAGQAPGLSNYALGQNSGSPTSVLTEAQMPVHTHTLPGGGSTGPEGGGQPMSILQPSLALNYYYDSVGVYPSSNGGGGGGESFLGQVRLTADKSPSDAAIGQLLPIDQNAALQTIYGTTFGGDGVNTFAVPDLRGRAPIGTSRTSSPDHIGAATGAEQRTLTVAQLPSHTHTIPAADGGGSTGATGNGQSFSTDDPTLGLSYIISLQGLFESGPSGGTPAIGQVALFGGDFAPSGWAFCDGQLLQIRSNAALFALIGTQYGGDGINTFALPDLQGKVAIDEGTDSFGDTYKLGQSVGADDVTLSVEQIADHDHAVPEPDSLMAFAAAPLLLRRRARGTFSFAK